MYILELTMTYKEVMMVPCEFRPTTHAKDRMIERGISRREAVEAIVKGAKRHNGPRIFSKLRGIEVVYVQRPCTLFVVTIHRR
jgi:hypothetical protein